MSDGVSDAVDYQLAISLNGVERTGNDGTKEDGAITSLETANNYCRLQLT